MNDGVAIFYGANGQPVASLVINAPANCSWTWNGWDLNAAPMIKWVEIWGPVLPDGSRQHSPGLLPLSCL